MTEDMTDAERFLLRVRLSSEFKRLVSVIATNGKDMIATMKTPAGREPIDIRLRWGFMNHPDGQVEIHYIPRGVPFVIPPAVYQGLPRNWPWPD